MKITPTDRFAATKSQSETPRQLPDATEGAVPGLERGLRRIGINVGPGPLVKKSMISLTQSAGFS